MTEQATRELFPDCTRSCSSQVVLCCRGGDRIYEMRCLFVAVGPNARFIVLMTPGGLGGLNSRSGPLHSWAKAFPVIRAIDTVANSLIIIVSVFFRKKLQSFMTLLKTLWIMIFSKRGLVIVVEDENSKRTSNNITKAGYKTAIGDNVNCCLYCLCSEYISRKHHTYGN